MSTLRLRPRFESDTSVEPNAVLQRLHDALHAGTGIVTGTTFTSCVVLRIDPSATHFWSPRLEISVDPRLEGGSTVRGLFGPRPAIWSLFVALYAATGFLATMGVIYGWSDLSLGGSGAALWAGPAGIGVAGVIYVAGRIGRRLGMEQMHVLKQFLDTALAQSPDA